MGCFLSDSWLAAIGLMNPTVLCALPAWEYKQFLHEHFMYRHKSLFLPIKCITLKLLPKNILANCEKLLQIQNEITFSKISKMFFFQVFNLVHHGGFMFCIVFPTLCVVICLFLMFPRGWSSSTCCFHYGVKVKPKVTGEPQKTISCCITSSVLVLRVLSIKTDH